MAKTKHNNILDTIDEIWTDAKNKGAAILMHEDEIHNGRKLKILGKEVLHFGTCEYMALGNDERLKEAAIDQIKKCGVQFAVSRAFVSSKINHELEEYLAQIFETPVVISSSTSLGHIGVIPSIVRDEDAIILDHQVHASIQNAVQMVRPRGVQVEMIRHNNLEMLEEKIKELGPKYSKIWYMIDGVYSMYGDFAPIKDLVKLMDKYEQLHLYADDAHGMSWAGKHGRGYVLSQVDLHPKMVVACTLGKAFGVGGGIFVFPTQEMYRRFKTFSGALFFSAPIEPPMLGAAVASAKIHLSDEIYVMQKELQDRIQYCNDLIKKTQLPLLTDNTSPIFFIAMGTPAAGYNMVSRLMNEGFYVNLAVFPAVPVKNTGLRFSISRHLKMEDIKQFVDAMEYHYPLALKEEQKTLNDVRKAFKLPLIEEHKIPLVQNMDFTVKLETSIACVDRVEWDSLLGANGIFNWQGLKFMEKVFSNNSLPEYNWNFHYIIIKDSIGKPVLATFFTTAMWKEDMMAPASISRQIEEKRQTEPYYLTSKAVTLGSFITEGAHLYLDKNNSNWRKAFSILLKELYKEQERTKAQWVILRDFEDNDREFKEYIMNEGYIKMDIPESCVVENLTWRTKEEFLDTLTWRSKKHMRADVLRQEQFYEVEVKNNVSEEEIKYFYQLYQNVKSRNFDITVFDYPEKLLREMSEDPNWEFVLLYLKPEYEKRAQRLPIGVFFAYKTALQYCPLLMGIDYNFIDTYKIYKQTLYQIVKRASDLNLSKVYLGLSASMEKKKYGATIIPKVAYVQAKDNFNMELIGLIAAREK